LAEKDNLLFERELEAGNYEKLLKEARYRLGETEAEVEAVRVAMEKLKSGRVRQLEGQVD